MKSDINLFIKFVSVEDFGEWFLAYQTAKVAFIPRIGERVVVNECLPHLMDATVTMVEHGITPEDSDDPLIEVHCECKTGNLKSVYGSFCDEHEWALMDESDLFLRARAISIESPAD